MLMDAMKTLMITRIMMMLVMMTGRQQINNLLLMVDIRRKSVLASST